MLFSLPIRENTSRVHSGKCFMALHCITKGSYVDNCFEKLFTVFTIYTIYFLWSAELHYKYFSDAFLVNVYPCGIFLYRNEEPKIIGISPELFSMHSHASFCSFCCCSCSYFISSYSFRIQDAAKYVKIKPRWKNCSLRLITVEVNFRNFGFTVFNTVS